MKDKRLYHSVAEKIKERISNGVYPPGSRLPGERELAEQFGVSRVTIREAEIALQALGYISIKTGSGVYVLDSADSDARGLPSVSAFELTEARLLFESEAAALAARQISEDTLAHLEKLVGKMSTDRPHDEQAAQDADREFHLAIAAASGNAAIKYIVETLWKLRNELPEVRDVHAAICAVEDANERYSEHDEVLRALRERDPSAAREAMQAHFRGLLGSMIDVTEEQALEELRKKTSASRQRYLNSVATAQTS
jgi:DNA-binding FadR family transcriptional regulator